MLTSEDFSGVSFIWPNFMDNAWTWQSITSTKIVLHLFYLLDKALSSWRFGFLGKTQPTSISSLTSNVSLTTWLEKFTIYKILSISLKVEHF
jgi:hypothetical protein